MKQGLKLTLALLKPDICCMPLKSAELKSQILSNSFLVVRSSKLRLSLQEASEFYKDHQGKFFYNRLVTFMSSGPTIAFILAHPDAINAWRKLIGPTKVYKTQYEQPDSLRGQFGLTDTRNATHGSDSEETARKEISFFFKDFHWDQWFREEEPLFRENRINFDPDKFLHYVKR
ncbi:nucleoside diphosphate kinase 6-like [Artemia franciscana]|uniref:nucleoside diphosphate kinase 6-like n=1 Tax=Artemia franciscana TaxID=6661 RepID=UPI0032DA7CC5